MQPIGTEKEPRNRGGEREVDGSEGGERWVHKGLLTVNRTAASRRTRKSNAERRVGPEEWPRTVFDPHGNRVQDPGPAS